MSVYAESSLLNLLREISAQGVFTCFAIQRALVDARVLAPEWREELAQLAMEVTGQEMPHLSRDWAVEREEYEALQRHVLPAEALDEALRQHPNSWKNIVARAPSLDEGTADTSDGSQA